MTTGSAAVATGSARCLRGFVITLVLISSARYYSHDSFDAVHFDALTTGARFLWECWADAV